jgi:hypothetical protein
MTSTAIALTVVVAEAASDNGVALLLVLAVGALVGYVFSIRRRPFTNCRWCSGRAKDHGRLFSYAYRPCRHCDGNGRTLRLGARLLRTHPRHRH